MTARNDGEEVWAAVNHATCGQCHHYHALAGSRSGDCTGLPPAVSSGGFPVERVVGFHRPACALFRVPPVVAAEGLTVDEVKAQARSIAAAALAGGILAPYDGPACPKEPPKHKKGKA